MNHELNTAPDCARENSTYRSGKRILIGTGLILLGVLLLFEHTGYIEGRDVNHYWPLLISLIGLNKLLFSRFSDRKLKGCWQIFLGFWLFACLEHLWGWTFAVTWPMILIALGLSYIGSYVVRNKNPNNESAP